MTIYRPSVVVPLRPDAGTVGTAVDSANAIAKRAATVLDDIERRLAAVEAPAALGTWHR